MSKLGFGAVAALLLVTLLGGQAQAADKPTIQIVAPQSGATLAGDRLTITTHKTNFTYAAPAVNQQDREGQGNYRIFVDGKLATEDFGDVTALPTDTLPQLAAGEHTIEVRLYSNSGKLVEGVPAATTKVRLANAMSYAAQPGKPAIRITSDPTADGLGHYVIRTETSGYKLDGTLINNKPEDGIGHYHVYLDNGALANVGVGDISSIPSDINPGLLTPGDHEIYVVLETHQHSPIPGGTSQRVKFTVRAQDLQVAASTPGSTAGISSGISGGAVGLLFGLFAGGAAVLIILSSLFSMLGSRSRARAEGAKTQQQLLSSTAIHLRCCAGQAAQDCLITLLHTHLGGSSGQHPGEGQCTLC